MRNYFIYFVLVFFCFMLFISPVSFAAQNFLMNEIQVDSDIYDVVDTLIEHFDINTNRTFRVGSTSLYKTFDDFINVIDSEELGFDSFYFNYYYNGNGRSYYSTMTTGTQFGQGATSYFTQDFTISKGCLIANLANNSTGSWSNIVNNTNIGTSSNDNNNSYYVLLRDINGKWFEYSYNDFSVGVSNNLQFIPNQYNGTITLQVSGESVDFMRLNFDRSIGSSGLNLGYFTGFEDYDINCTSGPYLYNFIYSRTLGDTTYYCKNGTINSNNALYLVKNGNKLNLYINPQYYLYEQGYHVLISTKSRDQDDSSYLYFDSLDFACLPLGDNRTNGDFLINPDINGNYDLGYIYNLNGYFGSNPEVTNNNINYTLTNLFPSGESGDFFGLSFIDRDNWGFGQLVLWVYDGFINLLTNFDNVTINFGILGDISSASFSINNNTILTFLSLFTNSFCIILVVFWYYKLIRSISTLNLSAVSSFSFDNNFKMF